MSEIPHITILFEDEFLLIVDKPAGIHSSALPGDNGLQYTVASFLTSYLKDANLISEKQEDAGLVHRHDGGTSGALLAAKTGAVWRTLREMIQTGKIEKQYLALVEGEFPPELTVSSFIGSPNRGAAKMRNFSERPRKKDRALPARTDFTRRTYYMAHNISLITAEAATARRHQIRVHAATKGYPLVGDSLYGATSTLPQYFPELGARQFLLHAERIRFFHPITREIVSVECPLMGLQS